MIVAEIQLGTDVDIHPSSTINYVNIGDHTKIGKGCHILGGPGQPVEIRGHTIIGMFTVIEGIRARVQIAENVSIAQQTVIVSDWQVPPGFRLASLFPLPAAPIFIGNNTWIGSSCIIAPGVTIGECCIIATNSYVNEDVPPYSIYGGNPAKLIRKLDPKELGPL